ncbi:MAG: methyltransferase [Candidatus Diapherotrites archaeon]|uniref:Methyltransferase n=1 Tax=Candidatus Iainarchaeum sp. TaxID=3101447 RepID=A0A7K4BYH7_9ARCH|nr:methyltransferase [Candidatus Diapherotrites archaeon]
MNLFEELQQLMLKYNFKPEKKLSQFFCTNEALLIYMSQKAQIKNGDTILEIGAGTGFLTKKLLEKTKNQKNTKIIVIEQDKNMVNILENEYKKEIEDKKLEIIYGDALEQDFVKLKINKIVSLPPYHISTALTNKIILSNIEKSILVVDRGFALKVTAFEGLTEYNALSAFVNLNSKIEILEENISATSFFPTPNCLSSLIQINLDKKNTSKEYFLFLKEIFRHKNKDLSKSLKQSEKELTKTLKIKNYKQKTKTIKTLTKKVYLHTPKELLQVYEEITK